MSKHNDKAQNYKAAGEYLKALRLGAQLTQAEAATQSGLSAIFISGVENGRQRPSVRSLVKLAHAYESDLKELLHAYDYPEDALVPPRRAGLTGVATRLDERRLDWALSAIARDYEYSIADNWENLPYVAQALLVRLYQSETGRRLLRDDETQALNHIVHSYGTPTPPTS